MAAGNPFRRVIIVVLDGVGIGALPDAADFGDEGTDSLGHVVRARGKLAVPNLAARGLARLATLPGYEDTPVVGAYGTLAMQAPGKDSIDGHWELAGVIPAYGFPLFPDGFPPEVLAKLRAATGRELIGNKAASGTAIIAELGEEHLATGALILYTSADSVCQLAAHVDEVPPAALCEMGRRARDAMTGPYAVARVIVRPFAGQAGAFRRLDGDRRDFALAPPAPTLLDRLVEAGLEVRGIGKVDDLFAGRGFTASVHTRDNDDGVARIAAALGADFEGIVLANLNDTDTVYGHRNNAAGYAGSLERFDAALPALGARVRDDDLVVIMSDHGNDPTTPGTDHTREYTPLLAWHPRLDAAVPLGVRATLADVGQTVAANFGLEPLAAGKSFLDEIGA